MESLEELQYFLEKGYLDYRANLTVDCVIFGYHDGELQVLLLKNKAVTTWCLPGGYVRNDETLEHAAIRITAERTGMPKLFLKQFKTFGDPGRNSPGEEVDTGKILEMTHINVNENNWFNGETTSVGYYAITDIISAKPKADFLSSECRWFSVSNLPKLGFDHDEMVREALTTMRVHLYHFPIGKNLLQQKFTLKEIKHFYEVMSGKQLNPSNFPNKLITLGIVIKLDEKKKMGAHRSPVYYRFNEEIYENALKEGLVLA